ncbi:SagB/ThcOx family dehydrogenase [Candidatus Woesearchaeota archaeon]|nr:SagB/ThcOx family dehydrogenase [Candidatus Woesearchaeota archaeon]
MNEAVIFAILLILAGCASQNIERTEGDEIKLSEPAYEGRVSLENALAERRAERSFTAEPLKLDEVSQILWASQGIDGVTGATRTAPSAGATQPLVVYLIAADVTGLEPGAYRYDPSKHTATKVSEISEGLPYGAPAYVIFTAIYERTSQRYGDRGERYVHIEVGHSAQNVHLQAISLGLKTFPIGAFDDGFVSRLLSLENEVPLYVVPVGR